MEKKNPTETEMDPVQSKVQPTEVKASEDKVSLRLANETLNALKALQTKYQDGISYRDYLEELEKVKSCTNRFLESREAQKRFLFVNTIRNVMTHYKNAARVWGYNNKDTKGYVFKTREDIRLYLEIYPKAQKSIEMGGASGTVANPNDVIWMDRLVSIIMHEASKELEKASRFLQFQGPPS
jgi:hypothetical protein